MRRLAAAVDARSRRVPAKERRFVVMKCHPDKAKDQADLEGMCVSNGSFAALRLTRKSVDNKQPRPHFP